MGKPSRSPALYAGRSHTAGNTYLVTAVSRNRYPFFRTNAAAAIVLDNLQWLDADGRMTLWAAVVMPDHIHFVTSLGDLPLSTIMHSLKSFSANRINGFLARRGPVWERGCHDHGIRNDQQFNFAIRYCVENPIRAGLVTDIRDYPHVSCRYGIDAALALT